jgi:ABC-type branched-subunit amino acid transport system permease subunit
MKPLLGRQDTLGILIVMLVLAVFPLVLDEFRLNLMGKYLAYAFVAVGIVLTWGYGGMLSLGQGMFFGIGGYMMAMFLKLEDGCSAGAVVAGSARLHGVEQRGSAASLVGTLPQPDVHRAGAAGAAGAAGLHVLRVRRIQASGSAACTSPSSRWRCRDPGRS